MLWSLNLLQLPIPRGGIELDYSRWMQNLIGILQIDVTFFKGKIFNRVFSLYFCCNFIDFIEWELMEPRVPVTIDARLGYRNKGDPEDEWKEYATSTESRTMDCSPPEVIFILSLWRSQCFFQEFFFYFLLFYFVLLIFFFKYIERWLPV